jgi:hypothetical protein
MEVTMSDRYEKELEKRLAWYEDKFVNFISKRDEMNEEVMKLANWLGYLACGSYSTREYAFTSGEFQNAWLKLVSVVDWLDSVESVDYDDE